MGAAPGKKRWQNVKKTAAHPKRSIAGDPEEHPQGLWVNVDFFRKLTTRDPITLVQGSAGTANRYLELADLVLDPKKPKKKSKDGSPEDV